MKVKKQLPSWWFFVIAALIILLGLLVSGWIMNDSGITNYPAMISNAYREDQHRLSVPGSTDVILTRTGAYGIYYEFSSVSASVENSPKMPPAIDCSLTSKLTGVEIEAVTDYVETNRYWSKDQGGTGVLIMSITVDEPDTYTFTCQYQINSTEPEIVIVALGPNYFWEFLRVAGKISISFLGAMTAFCGSILIGLIIIVIVAIKRGGCKTDTS